MHTTGTASSQCDWRSLLTEQPLGTYLNTSTHTHPLLYARRWEECGQDPEPFSYDDEK